MVDGPFVILLAARKGAFQSMHAVPIKVKWSIKKEAGFFVHELILLRHIY